MPEQSSHHALGWTVLVAGVLILGAAGGLLYFFTDLYTPASPSPTIPIEITQAVRSGEYEEAIARSIAAQGDSSKTADEKALAVFASLGSEFHVTGDVQTRLNDIRTVKKYIMDPNVSLWIRVDLLNALAEQYSNAGADPTIVDEIFEGEPFSQYRATAENDDRSARLSTRKLFEWSYSMMPTSVAAIQIARWYSEQRSFDSSLPADKVKEYADAAEDYLKKAEEAFPGEQARDPEFMNSARYLTYAHWRAVIMGRLAGGTDERAKYYESTYREAFDSFIEFTKIQKNVLGPVYRLYSRLFYARMLERSGDEAASTAQLDMLAEEMNAITNPETNVFIRFLQNEYNRRTGATWRNLVERRFDFSPAFKAAVEKAVGAPIE